MEKIEVDNKDRPIEDIVIEKAHIFVDPYQEADEALAKDRADELETQQKIVIEEVKRKERSQPLKVFRSGVGKYLSIDSISEGSTSSATPEPIVKKKKTEKRAGFVNFNAW